MQLLGLEHARHVDTLGPLVAVAGARSVVRADPRHLRDRPKEIGPGTDACRVVACLEDDRRRTGPSTLPVELVAADVDPSSGRLLVRRRP